MKHFQMRHEVYTRLEELEDIIHTLKEVLKQKDSEIEMWKEQLKHAEELLETMTRRMLNAN